MKWQHQYEGTYCAQCGANLKLPNAVIIEGRGNDGTYLGSFATSLDEDGRLNPDAAGILKRGFHAGSRCRLCGHALDEHEEVTGTGLLVQLASELQRLMYAESQDGRTIWNPDKQAAVSPVDLQQDLESLMRRYELVPGSSPCVAELRTTLSRSGCADLAAIISSKHGSLDISFPGYSDKGSDCGPVIYLELDEQGHPQLYAWTDITNEEPTHLLSFAAAMDERTVDSPTDETSSDERNSL